jgi:hypothetical protein
MKRSANKKSRKSQMKSTKLLGVGDATAIVDDEDDQGDGEKKELMSIAKSTTRIHDDDEEDLLDTAPDNLEDLVFGAHGQRLMSKWHTVGEQYDHKLLSTCDAEVDCQCSGGECRQGATAGIRQ